MLVGHVCDAWLNHLLDYTQTPVARLVDCTQTPVARRTRHHKDDTVTISPSTGDSPAGTAAPLRPPLPPAPAGRLAAVEAIIASMKDHTDLLIKAATFGPVHKKNIRLVIELNLRDDLILGFFFSRGNGSTCMHTYVVACPNKEVGCCPIRKIVNFIASVSIDLYHSFYHT